MIYLFVYEKLLDVWCNENLDLDNAYFTIHQNI